MVMEIVTTLFAVFMVGLICLKMLERMFPDIYKRYFGEKKDGTKKKNNK